MTKYKAIESFSTGNVSMFAGEIREVEDDDVYAEEYAQLVEDGYIVEYAEGTHVEANNEEETTDTLEKLKVGDKNYGIPKKIYCHPISIAVSQPHVMRITMLIFNNTQTPFTLSTLKDFFDSLVAQTSARARIMCSGACSKCKEHGQEAQDVLLIVSSLDKVLSSGGVYVLKGLDINGTNSGYSTSDWNDLFPPSYTEFVDGVNAIN